MDEPSYVVLCRNRHTGVIPGYDSENLFLYCPCGELDLCKKENREVHKNSKNRQVALNWRHRTIIAICTTHGLPSFALVDTRPNARGQSVTTAAAAVDQRRQAMILPAVLLQRNAHGLLARQTGRRRREATATLQAFHRGCKGREALRFMLERGHGDSQRGECIGNCG